MADQENQGGGDQPETFDVDEAQFPLKRQNNTLPLYGNKETMNINSMILTNIKQSPYFKTDLFKLKTFHEVVDEIFYRAEHLEPWERNSRKLSGQVGMCAGVRGVASGGIVSTPFCLLFKLFTLKLTRKQLTVMLNHVDSPYIRGLGFLYIRYCQPPNDFWGWYEPYFDDEEEIDLKAGGGFRVTIGGFCRMLLTKQDWFGTMFPRIPVNLQKVFAEKLKKRNAQERENVGDNGEQLSEAEKMLSRERELERVSRDISGIDSYSPHRRSRSLSRGRRDRSAERNRHGSRSRSSERRRYHNSSEDRDRGSHRGHSNSEDKTSRSKDKRRSRSRERRRSRSRDWRRSRSGDRRRSRSRERRRSRSRDRKSREHRSEHDSRSRGHRRHSRERSRSKDRKRKHHRSYSGERRHHRSSSNEL